MTVDKRLGILVAAALASFSTASRADQCDVIAANLAASEAGIQAVGARSEIGGITFSDPFASEVSIDCPTSYGAPIDLDVNWHDAYPPASFYAFAGRAGHIVTGATVRDAAEGTRRCVQMALGASDEHGQLTFGTAYFECQAFSRDGGGADIAIFNAKNAVPE
jgi:hypothetical protein